MQTRAERIARIRLARSLPRLMVIPVLLLVIGGASTVASVVMLAQPLVWAGVGIGALIAVAGLLFASWLSSIRVDVEEAGVRVRWLGGGRRYALTPGPVTRVRLRGADASRLRSGTSWLGWSVGRARLRDEEDIHVVRLAPSTTAILVPTDLGRLAIVPAEERELIDALSEAARARQRQQQEARDAEQLQASGGAHEAQAAERIETDASTDVGTTIHAEVEPHLLTGIERALLEERLAEERAAAEIEAAQAVARAAVEAEAARRAAAAAAAEAAAEESHRRRWEPFGPTVRRVPRLGPWLAVLFVPLGASAVVWVVAAAVGRLPEPTSDLGRLTALGLVLAGPTSTIAAIMARVWWPRLVGVVVISGLTTTLLLGRVLAGG